MSQHKKQKIADIASTTVLSIAADEPVSRVVVILAEKRLSCMLVTDAGKPVGIITERDLLRMINTGYEESTPVRKVMSFPLITVRKDLDFATAQIMLSNRGVRHLVLVDEAGDLFGIVTETDFRRHISHDLFKAIQHLSVVMDAAEELVPPETPLAQVLGKMAALRLDHMLIGRDGVATGIVTERDVPRLMAARFDTDRTCVGEVMSTPLQTIGLDVPVAEAARRLTEDGLRHLVVLNAAGKFAGIVSQHRLLERLSAVLLEHSRNRLAPQMVMTEQHFRDFVENLQMPLCHVNAQDELLYVNQRFVEDFGYNLNDVPTLAAWGRCAYPDPIYREWVLASWRAAVQDSLRLGRPIRTIEHRVQCKDGTVRFVEVGGITLGEEFLATFVDITGRKEAEDQLRQAASVFEHANEGIMITDAQGRILDVNAAFTRITGYGRDEVLGRSPSLLNSGRQGREFFAAMWQTLKETGRWTSEIWNRRKNGEVFAEMQTISAIQDETGRVQRYVALFSDITALKEHQQELEHIAHYDALTQLPNRVLLADRLQQALTQASRRQSHVAVVYLDLDGFKAINDIHGHGVGDRLLVALADRMKDALREGDTLARLGGDEFVAVLLDLVSAEACEPILARLLAAAADPVGVDDLSLRVSASIGVSFFPQAEDIDADQLMRQADQAMYQAKQAGKNRYHLFDAEQDRAVRGRHESIERIREALENREFVLYYQPKVNMRTGKVIGAEALIRWQHPEQGLLPPGQFLPLIENDELIVLIGDWTIEIALAQMETWRAAGLELPVSVNIAGRQLQSPGFLGKLKVALYQHPDVAHLLELEVLESSALDDIAQVSQVIESCLDMGVSFALDDFGTGYSSLTYLKRLPAQTLKIDQSFVRDMLDDPEDLAILDGVLGLTVAFQRQAVAEGVETPAHGEMLLRLGCELGQGYAIARPMPAAAITDWVASWRSETLGAGARPIGREDMPVLFAMTEHRAWVKSLGLYLRDKQNIPALDHRHCRFGQWLAGPGLGHRAGEAVLDAILSLHETIHRCAQELVALKQNGRDDEAMVRFGEVEQLRDELLARLQQVIDG